jgi:hypothetical protein
MLRYEFVHFVIYIENDDAPPHDIGGKDPTDAVGVECALPRLYTTKPEDLVHFVSVFSGALRLDRGYCFPLCGGCKHILLKPISNNTMFLSKAQGRRLQSLAGLNITCTLIPVAVPSAKFIYSLLDPRLPATMYPFSLMDAPLFERQVVKCNEFQGAALVSCLFKGRNLISTRHRGRKYGLLEFDLKVYICLICFIFCR